MHWSSDVKKAIQFATEAHAGQTRKFTGLPYIEHPLAVARMVLRARHDNSMLLASVLHDVQEDTPVTNREICKEFGADVAMLVSDLTDVSAPGDGNRATRKQIDRLHLARADSRAQVIKCMDSVHNIASVVRHDPKFAMTYVQEKLLLSGVLRDAYDPRAHAFLVRVCNRAVSRLGIVFEPDPVATRPKP